MIWNQQDSRKQVGQLNEHSPNEGCFNLVVDHDQHLNIDRLLDRVLDGGHYPYEPRGITDCCRVIVPFNAGVPVDSLGLEHWNALLQTLQSQNETHLYACAFLSTSDSHVKLGGVEPLVVKLDVPEAAQRLRDTDPLIVTNVDCLVQLNSTTRFALGGAGNDEAYLSDSSKWIWYAPNGEAGHLTGTRRFIGEYLERFPNRDRAISEWVEESITDWQTERSHYDNWRDVVRRTLKLEVKPPRNMQRCVAPEIANLLEMEYGGIWQTKFAIDCEVNSATHRSATSSL